MDDNQTLPEELIDASALDNVNMKRAVLHLQTALTNLNANVPLDLQHDALKTALKMYVSQINASGQKFDYELHTKQLSFKRTGQTLILFEAPLPENFKSKRNFRRKFSSLRRARYFQRHTLCHNIRLTYNGRTFYLHMLAKRV